MNSSYQRQFCLFFETARNISTNYDFKCALLPLNMVKKCTANSYFYSNAHFEKAGSAKVARGWNQFNDSGNAVGIILHRFFGSTCRAARLSCMQNRISCHQPASQRAWYKLRVFQICYWEVNARALATVWTKGGNAVKLRARARTSTLPARPSLADPARPSFCQTCQTVLSQLLRRGCVHFL